LLFAQTKLGDHPTIIHPGSLLELESLSKGLRLPRIKLDDVSAWTLDGTTPANGMLIFNTTGAAPKGMYYWDTDSIKWVRVLNAAELASLIKGTTTVSNSSAGNKLVTSVNGISALGVDIISTNSLQLVNGVLTSTVNGVSSSPGLLVLSTASNGVSVSNGDVQLGGALTKPTTIATTTANTLALTGLPAGDLATDSLLVVAPVSGLIRKVPASSLSGISVYKSIQFAVNAQLQFGTPQPISDPKKIQVYRNGINVEFSQTDSNHISLILDVPGCFHNDEIKIVQIQ
jgi:hypothetical protein